MYEPPKVIVVERQHFLVLSVLINIINHTLPSAIRGVMVLLLVRVWPIIAQASASAIMLYEYKSEHCYCPNCMRNSVVN